MELTQVLYRSGRSFVLGNYSPISLHFTWHSNLQLGCHKKCLGFWFSDETCDIASVTEKWRSVKAQLSFPLLMHIASLTGRRTSLHLRYADICLMSNLKAMEMRCWVGFNMTEMGSAGQNVVLITPSLWVWSLYGPVISELDLGSLWNLSSSQCSMILW